MIPAQQHRNLRQSPDDLHLAHQHPYQ
jgi:hypothetical protein